MAIGDVVTVGSGGGQSLTQVSPDTAGKVLTSNGVGSQPSFQSAGAPIPGSSNVPIVVTSDTTIPTNNGWVVPESLEIAAGVILEVEGGARLEITGPVDGFGMVKLAEVLPNSVGSILFSNISQVYKHLRIIYSGRIDQVATAAVLLLSFNEDASALYDRQLMQGNAAVSAATESLGQTALNQIGALTGASSAAGMAGAGEIIIQNYANSSLFKMLMGTFVFQTSTASGGMNIRTFGGAYRSTNPITSLGITISGGGNFITGTIFSLYGYN